MLHYFPCPRNYPPTLHYPPCLLVCVCSSTCWSAWSRGSSRRPPSPPRRPRPRPPGPPHSSRPRPPRMTAADPRSRSPPLARRLQLIENIFYYVHPTRQLFPIYSENASLKVSLIAEHRGGVEYRKKRESGRGLVLGYYFVVLKSLRVAVACSIFL